MKKEELIRVNVLMTREQRRRLFHILLDEGISFSEWTRRQIDAYIAEREPKRAGVRELVDRRQMKRWTEVQNDTRKKTKAPKREKSKGKEM